MSDDLKLMIRIQADVRKAVDQLNTLIKGLGDTGRTGKGAGDEASEGIKKIAVAAREGKRVTEQLMTAQERYNSQVARYQRLLDGAHISQETFNRAVAKSKRDLHGAGTEARHTGDALTRLRDTIAALYVARGAIDIVGALVNANIELQRIHYTLESVTGSAAGATQEFKYIRAISERFGLDLKTTAQGYARLAVSAKSAGVSQSEMHRSFVGLAQAFTVLHTPAEDVNGLLVQLEQGMSLGKLQMQDFRAIAQHLPGTFDLVSKAATQMGGSLQDMLQHGGVPAKQFFLAFTQLLHEKYGPEATKAAHSLNAELNRLHTTIFGLETQPSGFVESFIGSLRDLNQTLSDPSIQKGLAEMIGGLGKLVEWSAKAAAGFANLGKSIGEAFARMQVGSDQPYVNQIRTVEGHIRALNRYLSLVQGGGALERWIHGSAQQIRQEIATANAQLQHLKQLRAAYLQMGQEKHKSAQQKAAPTTSFADSANPLGLPGGDQTFLAALNKAAKQEVADAKKRQNAIDGVIASLRQQAATYGQNSQQVAVYRLRTLGATNAEITHAQALAKGIAGLQRHAQLMQEGKRLTDQMRTAQEKFNDTVAHYLELLKEGAIDEATYLRAVKSASKELHKSASRVGNDAKSMSDYLKEFNHSAKGILAGGFFDLMQGKIDNLPQLFKRAIDKMVADYLAAQATLKLFGKMGQTGQMGGWVGEAGSWIASFFHSGGMVGAGGSTSMVPASVFAGAPRFHTGGWPGLRSDEVPAILQRGEYVQSRKEVAQAGAGMRPVSVHMTIHTPDATSFKQSQQQIETQVALAMQRALRRNG